VRAHLDARLASGEFQIVARQRGVPGRQFTTAKTIAAEQEILHRMREGNIRSSQFFSRPRAIAVADRLVHLNHAQRTVVEDVLSAPDRIQGIQGLPARARPARSPSSAARRNARLSGRRLRPDLSRRAPLNEAGIEAGTLQRFLARSANPDLPEQRHFYLVDESSLASTNQIASFLSRLGPDDRVLLVGDIRQHQGVEAGRPFEQLQEAGMRTAKLDDIVRQHDPALKSAVEMLATGQVSAALDAPTAGPGEGNSRTEKSVSALSPRPTSNRPITLSSSHQTMLPAAS